LRIAAEPVRYGGRLGVDDDDSLEADLVRRVAAAPAIM
jgi:hypothetical protein